MNTPQPGEIYRHHSGTLYEVLSPVFDANTGEQLVEYRALDLVMDLRSGKHFLTPSINGPRRFDLVENFMREGRFERVK